MRHLKQWAARFLSLVCAGALALSLVPAAEAARGGAVSFPDVPEGEWYYSYVTELASIGGVKGYDDGTFGPLNDISLAEAAAILFNVFPIDAALEREPEVLSENLAAIRAANGKYWAGENIAKAIACRADAFGIRAERWEKAATREELAYLIFHIYAVYAACSGTEYSGSYYEEARVLIGDYDECVAGSEYEPYILWLYSNGIVSGVNSQGDYRPKANISRAECCTIAIKLLYPQRRGKVSLEDLVARLQGQGDSSGTDFTGKTRVRYSQDVAYDFCRALEEQIGIQIFYLPEWTVKEAGLIQYEDVQPFLSDPEFYADVLAELKKMKAAFDLYPEGFLKEMVRRKGRRGAEIILCPYTFEGMLSYGVHVYDYSGDAKKVDQIYYTGCGDPQFYSHEMGHMAVSSTAILNGFNATAEKWVGLSTGTGSYVSSYAMTGRPEDWAETWAYLWHQTDSVMARCSDAGLKAKVRYLSQLLDKYYDTVTASRLPWAAVLD